jgi:O-antigen ligase
VKWLIPGILLFDGCRTKPRLYIALFAVASIYLLLSLQVIKWIPVSYAISGESLGARSHSILRKEIGIHRTDVAVMLAGGAWAIFALKELFDTRGRQFVFLGISMITVFGLALTAGRAGYLAWALIGLFFIFLRWRMYMLLVLFVVLPIITTVPGIYERMMEGINIQEASHGGENDIDVIRVTAGRSIVWPLIVEKIKESPWRGFGRLAIIREGITYSLWSQYNEEFPHPHNAYLEMLLDNRIIGAIPVISLFLIFLIRSLSLFLKKSCRLFISVGGLSSSLLIAFLIGSFTGQTFYAQETNVGMYCGIGLMLRMYVENGKIVQISRPEQCN